MSHGGPDRLQPVAVIPPAPWRGRQAEEERTPDGCLIVRGPHGAHYQPPGEAYWLPYETAEELSRKLFRKPQRRQAAVMEWSVWQDDQIGGGAG